jgi:hypothetical protein
LQAAEGISTDTVIEFDLPQNQEGLAWNQIHEARKANRVANCAENQVLPNPFDNSTAQLGIDGANSFRYPNHQLFKVG